MICINVHYNSNIIMTNVLLQNVKTCLHGILYLLCKNCFIGLKASFGDNIDDIGDFF